MEAEGPRRGWNPNRGRKRPFSNENGHYTRNPNPNSSYLPPFPEGLSLTERRFAANRDACGRLWSQLEEGLNAREMCVMVKETEVVQRERVVLERERAVEGIEKEMEYWKSEALHFKEKYLQLRGRVDGVVLQSGEEPAGLPATNARCVDGSANSCTNASGSDGSILYEADGRVCCVGNLGDTSKRSDLLVHGAIPGSAIFASKYITQASECKNWCFNQVTVDGSSSGEQEVGGIIGSRHNLGETGSGLETCKEIRSSTDCKDLGSVLPDFPCKVKVELADDVQPVLVERLHLLRSANEFLTAAEADFPSQNDMARSNHVSLSGDMTHLRSSSLLHFHGDHLNEEVKENVLDTKKRKAPKLHLREVLEEDAPELLKVLLDKDLNLDELKLYGIVDLDESADEVGKSSDVDNFAELESVCSKLFSRPAMMLKMTKIVHAKGTGPSYCLSCLMSLIEQTKQFQSHQWPVEWGWCSTLRSFIFVFQRHNRIVVERPEYGYATYFFELVPSLPIDWQIRRLIAAMKLSSCGRATVIENKPLVVGQDLNDDEARILESYGWRPNTGIGSMLNYCNRVIHDRKAEEREWRIKIGKHLMDGYDKGTILLSDIPRKVLDEELDYHVKLEVDLHYQVHGDQQDDLDLDPPPVTGKLDESHQLKVES